MERTNVYLPKTLKIRIKTRAARNNQSEAQVIREALDLGLRGQGARPNFLGQLEKMELTGSEDLSVHLDDYLYGDRS